MNVKRTATLLVDREVKIEFQRTAIVGRVGEKKQG